MVGAALKTGVWEPKSTTCMCTPGSCSRGCWVKTCRHTFSQIHSVFASWNQWFQKEKNLFPFWRGRQEGALSSSLLLNLQGVRKWTMAHPLFAQLAGDNSPERFIKIHQHESLTRISPFSLCLWSYTHIPWWSPKADEVHTPGVERNINGLQGQETQREGEQILPPFLGFQSKNEAEGSCLAWLLLVTLLLNFIYLCILNHRINLSMEQISSLNTGENRCVFCLEHTVKTQLFQGSQADPAAGTRQGQELSPVLHCGLLGSHWCCSGRFCTSSQLEIVNNKPLFWTKLKKN